MSILASLLLLQAAVAPPTDPSRSAATTPRQAAIAATGGSKICRDMLISSSRLGAIKVCKTRAQWRRWERCHSATRYCAPPRQQTVTVASLPDDKLVCKYLKTTGSRLDQQKICATKRQWDVTEQDIQESVRDLQSSTKLVGDTNMPFEPHSPGPR